MKKNFVILSLLSLMPFLRATESMQVGPVVMQPVYQWYDASMIPAQVAFHTYYDFIAKNGTDIESVAGDAIAVLRSKIQDILNKIPATINVIVDEKTGEKRFDMLIDTYCIFVLQAGSNLKDLAQYKNYLNDVGTFVGMMCSRMINDLGSIDTLNVRTEVALRNDGYKREYFLGEVEDTEKKDGIRRYFYSEPTKRPAMWRSLLGFGYTDKRGWFRYAFDKLKYPAAAGIVGYAGYRNREALKPYGEKALTKGKEYAGKISRHAKAGAGYVAGAASSAAGFVSRHTKAGAKTVRRKYRDITGVTRQKQNKKMLNDLETYHVNLKNEINEEDQLEKNRIQFEKKRIKDEEKRIKDEKHEKLKQEHIARVLKRQEESRPINRVKRGSSSTANYLQNLNDRGDVQG